MRPLRMALAGALWLLAGPTFAQRQAPPQDLAHQLTAARGALQARLTAIESTSTAKTALFEHLAALEWELDRYWNLRIEQRTAVGEAEGLVTEIKGQLRQVKTAKGEPPAPAVERIRIDLDLLLHPRPVRGGGGRSGGPGPSAGPSTNAQAQATPSGRGYRSGTRALSCAGVFDGAGCGGQTTATNVAFAAGTAVPGAQVSASAGRGPATVGGGANPHLENHDVPAPGAWSALGAGIGDAVHEQFGTAAGLAMNLGGMFLGLLLTVVTGPVGVALKLIAALLAVAGIGALVWQLWGAIKAFWRAPAGSAERAAAMRRLGYVGGTVLIMAAMAFAGFKIGKTQLGQAAMLQMRAGLARGLGAAGLMDEAGVAIRVAEARAATRPGRFETTRLGSRYYGENRPNNRVFGSAVRYLTDAEREAFRLTIRGGKLYDAAGKLFDTTATRTARSGQAAIVVMDGEGNIFASLVQRVGEFHHSSLLGGKPAAFAGEIVVENGVLKAVNNMSGHYRPPARFLQQFMRFLQAEGVDVSGVATSTPF